jgi:uncharacterized protein (TIRG00374 family)
VGDTATEDGASARAARAAPAAREMTLNQEADPPGDPETPAEPTPTPTPRPTPTASDHGGGTQPTIDDLAMAPAGHVAPAADAADDADGVVSDVPASPGRRPSQTAPRRRWIPRQVKWTITTVVLFFVFFYIVLPEIASARKSLHQIQHINVFGLILAVVLEVLSLIAYAELTHTVISPDAPGRFKLFRVNMSSLAVSHVLPGGTAPGTALAYRLLTDLDVPGSTAALGLATQGAGSALVLNAIFWLVLLVSIPINGYNPAYGYVAIIGVILLGLFFGTIYLLTQGKRAAADRLKRVVRHVPFISPEWVDSTIRRLADRVEVLLRNRPLLFHAAIWAALNWLLDAASLWVFLLSFGQVVSPIDLLVAYGLANILAGIPITPGGLGVVEFTLTATLTGFGVPGRVAALGVLSWRLINFWLPIPAGGMSYLSLRFDWDFRHLRLRRKAPPAVLDAPPGAGGDLQAGGAGAAGAA